MVKGRRGLFLVLLVIVVLAIAGLLFAKFYIFKTSETSVASRKADVEITANELVKNFETNEKDANARYLSKIILVKGIVDNVAETKSDTAPEITVYLKEKNKTSGVMCSFNKNVISKDTVKPGDSVSIKGICSGFLMDVVMNKCALVK